MKSSTMSWRSCWLAVVICGLLTSPALLAQVQPAGAAGGRTLFVLEDGSTIRALGGGQWAEYHANGTLRRGLKEVNRTPAYIELTTSSPKPLSIRLFDRTSTFKVFNPNTGWDPWKAGSWRNPR